MISLGDLKPSWVRPALTAGSACRGPHTRQGWRPAPQWLLGVTLQNSQEGLSTVGPRGAGWARLLAGQARLNPASGERDLEHRSIRASSGENTAPPVRKLREVLKVMNARH